MPVADLGEGLKVLELPPPCIGSTDFLNLFQ